MTKLSKFRSCADNKINMIKKLKCVFGRIENIVGKRENSGDHHFLLLTQCFQKVSFTRSLKVGIVPGSKKLPKKEEKCKMLFEGR